MDSKRSTFSEAMSNERWDRRFLKLAQAVSDWSRDPSTKVGAVAVLDRRILATGYNGLPRGVADTAERLETRELKYQMVAHAEANLLAHAAHAGTSLNECTVYVWPFHPCGSCAGLLINSGVARVVIPELEVPERWAFNFSLARTMFEEAGVALDQLAINDEREVVA
jgi:dCMP deaminase